ncbi:MAG: hypothetical protein P4L50_05325 [Anaerolineaceae bacterium]|nr:hypothetical protein [Anaerolineaceae bacterium]
MQTFLRANYHSGWLIIVYPILIFLTILIGFPLIIYFGLEWQSTAWLVIAIVSGFVLGLVLSLTTYPIFLRVARRQYGEIGLTSEAITWRAEGALWAFRRTRTIHFNQPYRARLLAGEGDQGQPGFMLEISAYKATVALYWKGISCSDLSDKFDAPDFVDELTISSSDGLVGFDLDGSQPLERALLDSLLGILWQTRQNNQLFASYQINLPVKV